MFIDLQPGGGDAPVAKRGFTIPIRATQPDVNPDEVLSVLDTDTREYLQLLVNGLGQRARRGAAATCATCSRASSRRTATSRSSTARSPRAASSCAISSRSLNILSTELAKHDDDLARLVNSSSAVFDSFAKEQANVSSAVHELPSTLSQTTDTLNRVDTFAELLGPTTEKLRPAARALAPANEAVRPFAKEATPQLRKSIRPFVRESRPLVRDLKPVSTRAAGRRPNLTQVFLRFNHFLNLLGYNPDGKEDPEQRGPPGGLPVLAGVAEPLGHRAVLELRRQRHASARSRSPRRARRWRRCCRRSRRSSSPRC